MESKRLLMIVLGLLFIGIPGKSQDDLLSLIEDEPTKNYAFAIFKGTRIINGHSTKLRKSHELEFLISHRFGPVSGGSYELWGLDEANVRLALEYGISDVVNIGIGHSSFEKTYDAFFKWKFLRQQTGVKNIPISMAWFSSVAVTTLRTTPEIPTADKTGYTHELLISRKFSSNFSFQLMPGFVHLNAVPTVDDPNDIFYLGGGLRYKITPSVALTMEYYYRFNEFVSIQTYDPIGIGFDIETGGHVFQLHFTNPRAAFEKGFITETTDDFWKGEIRFGFNISRTFHLGEGKKSY